MTTEERYEQAKDKYEKAKQDLHDIDCFLYGYEEIPRPETLLETLAASLKKIDEGQFECDVFNYRNRTLMLGDRVIQELQAQVDALSLDNYTTEAPTE
jgi:hypothetical protein